jgi:thiol-disulfide isomerase/thioredoxin
MWTWTEGHHKSGKPQFELFHGNFESTRDVIEWIFWQKMWDCTVRNPDMSKLSALAADEKNIRRVLQLDDPTPRRLEDGNYATINQMFTQDLQELKFKISERMETIKAEVAQSGGELPISYADTETIHKLLERMFAGEEIQIDAVVDLDGDRLMQMLNNNKKIFMMVHTTNCPHCQDAMPALKRIGTALHDHDVIVARINAADPDRPQNKEIARALNVEQVPSFYSFNFDRAKVAGRRKRSRSQFESFDNNINGHPWIQYNGQRTVGGFASEIQQLFSVDVVQYLQGLGYEDHEIPKPNRKHSGCPLRKPGTGFNKACEMEL